jgi:branched-chain amino acid transport system substrate-binding protein
VSIWRGMVLAVDEINADGGLLGKKLQIVVKDHHANPIRGVENLRQFADMDRLLAVMGGMHTPVMLEELPAIHDNQIISLVPWAAGTPIVDNGYDPNYVFRLSVRDEYAGPFLVRKLVNAGYEKPALFLEKTGWGRSNRRALTEALENRGLSPATVQWFNWSEKSFREEIDEAHDNGADIIVFVGNAPEGATLVHSMSEQESSDRLPILSHWGITGGEFFSEMQDSLNDVQLRVLQTRSFLDPANPQYARDEIQVYCAKFTCPDSGSRNIIAPVGTAHAHDLIHLLAQAVDKANSPSRPKIRKALEQLGDWPGIVRTYSRPFTPSDHEALTLDDLRLARYDSSGHLVLSDLE